MIIIKSKSEAAITVTVLKFVLCVFKKTYRTEKKIKKLGELSPTKRL